MSDTTGFEGSNPPEASSQAFTGAAFTDAVETETTPELPTTSDPGINPDVPTHLVKIIHTAQSASVVVKNWQGTGEDLLVQGAALTIASNSARIEYPQGSRQYVHTKMIDPDAMPTVKYSPQATAHVIEFDDGEMWLSTTMINGKPCKSCGS